MHGQLTSMVSKLMYHIIELICWNNPMASINLQLSFTELNEH